MTKKRVYFVRHGETISNTGSIVQGLNDPLTPEGERQALLIAERAKGIEFEALLSSDAVRAHETAKAISQATGKEVELSPLFREAKRPTSLEGTSRDRAEYKELLKTEAAHWGKKDWRFEDEENYDDLMARARAAIAHIEAHPAENLMVVTHGRFLQFIIGLVIFEDAITPETMFALTGGMWHANTGITVCYTTEDLLLGKERWRLLTWNDHAHFAE